MGLVALPGGSDPDPVLTGAHAGPDFEQEIVDQDALAMAAAGLDGHIRRTRAIVIEFVLTLTGPPWAATGVDADAFLAEQRRLGHRLSTRADKAGTLAGSYDFVIARYEGTIHAAISLAAPVRTRLAAWLDYSSRTWSGSLNPHLLINRRTAPRLVAAGHSFPGTNTVFRPQALREDRFLHEIRAIGGDVPRLCDLFGLSVEGATRYLKNIEHPDLSTEGGSVSRSCARSSGASGASDQPSHIHHDSDKQPWRPRFGDSRTLGLGHRPKRCGSASPHPSPPPH